MMKMTSPAFVALAALFWGLSGGIGGILMGDLDHGHSNERAFERPKSNFRSMNSVATGPPRLSGSKLEFKESKCSSE